MSRDIRTLFLKMQAEFAKTEVAIRKVAEVFDRLAEEGDRARLDRLARIPLPAHLAAWENEGGAL